MVVVEEEELEEVEISKNKGMAINFLSESNLQF